VRNTKFYRNRDLAHPHLINIKEIFEEENISDWPVPLE
jgi:hypothetical protein